MTSMPQGDSRTDSAIHVPPTASGGRTSRLLSGIYHDIGLAAVALGLEMPIDDLEPDVGEAVKRGARYIYLMPRTK